MLQLMKKQTPINGEIIKLFRDRERLSQKELGDLIDKDASVISTWETGKISPGTHSLHKLATIFKVDVSVFFKQKDQIDSYLMPTIVDAVDVLDAYYKASKNKRDEVINILGIKTDDSK